MYALAVLCAMKLRHYYKPMSAARMCAETDGGRPTSRGIERRRKLSRRAWRSALFYFLAPFLLSMSAHGGNVESSIVNVYSHFGNVDGTWRGGGAIIAHGVICLCPNV